MASVILWMQSGHAQEVAARRYVELRTYYTLHGQLSNCEGNSRSFQDSKGMVNGTGEAGQGTLEAGPLPSADSEAGGPCCDSDTDVT